MSMLPPGVPGTRVSSYMIVGTRPHPPYGAWAIPVTPFTLVSDSTQWAEHSFLVREVLPIPVVLAVSSVRARMKPNNRKPPYAVAGDRKCLLDLSIGALLSFHKHVRRVE